MGLRNSCEASATKRRCRSTAVSRAASVSFVVTARRPISSCVSGSGTRRDRSVDRVIAAISRRMPSTGPSARRVTSQVTTATTASSSGTATSMEVRTLSMAARSTSSGEPA